MADPKTEPPSDEQLAADLYIARQRALGDREDAPLSSAAPRIRRQYQQFAGELQKIRSERACVCATGNPADYDGPDRDCPVHGERIDDVRDRAQRALAEGQAAREELARVRSELAEAIGAPHDADLNTLVRRTRIDYAALIKQRNEALAELEQIRRYDEPIGSVLYDVIRRVQFARLDDHEAVRQIEQRLIRPLIARQKKAEAAARRARPSRRRKAWADDVGRRTVARLIDAWEDGADPFDTLRRIKGVVADNAAAGEEGGPAVPEVTVPEGTPPAAQRCSHRDFDDPTRCWTCFP